MFHFSIKPFLSVKRDRLWCRSLLLSSTWTKSNHPSFIMISNQVKIRWFFAFNEFGFSTFGINLQEIFCWPAAPWAVTSKSRISVYPKSWILKITIQTMAWIWRRKEQEPTGTCHQNALWWAKHRQKSLQKLTFGRSVSFSTNVFTAKR